MTVETRQLALFVAVAEELHFRRAARRVALTQPALSRQVAQLEAQLGVRLLERSRRGVALTDAGRVLLEGSRRLLADAARLAEDARRAGGAQVGRVILGYVEYMNPGFLPRLIRELRTREPGVVVEHRELYSAEVLAALGERTIDVGMVVEPVTAPGLVARRVLEGRWTVVMPAGHRLAAGAEVALAELRDEPIILFDRSINPPLYDAILARFRAAGVEPRVVYNPTQAAMGTALAAEGVGVFVTASYVVRALPRGLASRPVADFREPIRIAAVWRADARSETLKTFVWALGRAVGAKGAALKG